MSLYTISDTIALKGARLMVTEAKKRANRKYDDSHTKQVHLKLNTKTDADILKRLQECDSIQGYIKELIRADMIRSDIK